MTSIFTPSNMLKGRVAASKLRGRWILVGATALELAP